MSTEDKYNPNDPEFLASRALNEPLTQAQRQIFGQHLSDMEAMQDVDELVQSIRDEAVDIDWVTFQQTIQDRITCAYDDANLDRVDALIQNATKLPTSWAEEDFTQDVLQKIASNADVRPARFRWLSAAMPLAAAAAITLVVTMVPWQELANAPTSIVSIGPAIQANHRPSLDSAVALVSFRREPIAVDDTANNRSRISFVSVGAESMASDHAPAPPL